MGRILVWTGKILAYLGYGLAVLFVLLWYLFPEATVRKWLENRMDRLNPELAWQMDRIRFTPPLTMVMETIRVGNVKDRKMELTMERLAITPDLGVIFRERQPGVRYRLSCCGGELEGTWKLETADERLSCRGTATGLHLAALQPLFGQLNRQVEGILSGTFSFQAPPGALLQGSGEMNLSLADGRLTFQAPVLGMEDLPYSRISMHGLFRDKALEIDQGKVESKRLEAEFSGRLTLSVPWPAAGVELSGIMQPRPEFFGTLGNPRAVELIRKKLKNGGLAFTVSGPLAEPGILFADIPASFNAMLQGGRTTQ